MKLYKRKNGFGLALMQGNNLFAKKLWKGSRIYDNKKAQAIMLL